MPVLDISDDALTIELDPVVSDITLDTDTMDISTDVAILGITHG